MKFSIMFMVIASSFLINAQSSSLRPALARQLQSIPTINPTFNPTGNPTDSPTENPTVSPTENPTNNPTTSPTKNPTNNPTTSPTDNPTSSPTENPTVNPTNSPITGIPTESPTNDPTISPTISPTDSPTNNLTDSPTSSPTTSPTNAPTTSPTTSPTFNPTTSPTGNPTRSPLPAVPESDGVDFALIGGAIGGTVCLIVVFGGLFIFLLLGRRTNRVRAGKKPVDENLLRSLAVLDDKKRAEMESQRSKKSAKANRSLSPELNEDMQITDLRAEVPAAPESVISVDSSLPPPGLESGTSSVRSASSHAPPGIASPKPQMPVMPRLSEVSVASASKLEPPGLGNEGLPRMSSGNVNVLPRVMSKTLEKQKVTAELEEMQETAETETAKAKKKPSVLDE